MEILHNLNSVKVGHAQSEFQDTGCTVISFDKPMLAAVDIRGGAAAVRESSSIEELNSDSVVDAIVLAGGSSYGLEASSGVMKRILEKRQSGNFMDIGCVPSAIVYDFRNRKEPLVYPTREMGEKAFDEAREFKFKIGQVGAGSNVWVGKSITHLEKERGGLGAFYLEKGHLKLLGITVVNALGNIVSPENKILKGSLDPKTQIRHSIPDWILSKPVDEPEKGNTTISLIVTNYKLSRPALKRLAVMAHTAMGKVIEPFHTPWDGDVMFAVSTSEIEPKSNQEFEMHVLAGQVMQKSVLSLC